MPYFCFDKITIGPITFYTWGIFLALAFIASFFLVVRELKKAKIDVEIMYNVFFWVVLGTIIGARLGYIFQFPKYFFSQPLEILKIWQGGLTFHGGFFGILIAGIIYFKLTKNSFKLFFSIADLVVLVAPLSIVIGRIGCSLINDHQGAETTLPWGIIWPDGTIRHPVAEYLIISALILFLILRFLKPRLKQPGQLFFAFLLLYSFSRFLLDFTRSIGTPLSDLHYFSLTAAQWLSLVIILAIIVIGVIKKFKRS